MTDNEIIKAWEKILATGDAPVGEHWSCGGVVTTKLAKDTLGLINRQKAEIERLKKGIKDADEKFSTGEIGKGLAIIINLVKEMVGDSSDQ